MSREKKTHIVVYCFLVIIIINSNILASDEIVGSNDAKWFPEELYGEYHVRSFVYLEKLKEFGMGLGQTSKNSITHIIPSKLRKNALWFACVFKNKYEPNLINKKEYNVLTSNGDRFYYLQTSGTDHIIDSMYKSGEIIQHKAKFRSFTIYSIEDRTKKESKLYLTLISADECIFTEKLNGLKRMILTGIGEEDSMFNSSYYHDLLEAKDFLSPSYTVLFGLHSRIIQKKMAEQNTPERYKRYKEEYEKSVEQGVKMEVLTTIIDEDTVVKREIQIYHSRDEAQNILSSYRKDLKRSNSEVGSTNELDELHRIYRCEGNILIENIKVTKEYFTKRLKLYKEARERIKKNQEEKKEIEK